MMKMMKVQYILMLNDSKFSSAKPKGTKLDWEVNIPVLKISKLTNGDTMASNATPAEFSPKLNLEAYSTVSIHTLL